MKDHKKTQRQLEIMNFIGAHPKGVTIRELVTRFTLSERTIRRYLAELKESDWLDQEIKDAGFWKLKNNPVINQSNLSEAEVLVLILAGQYSSQVDYLKENPTLIKILDKLTLTLPIDKRAFIKKIQQVNVKDFRVTRSRRIGFPNHTQLIQDAILKGKCIEFTYHKLDEHRTNKRIVAPIRFKYYDDSGYLIGYCRWRNSPRIFSLNRIESVTILDEAIKPEERKCVEEHFQYAFIRFGGDKKYRVKIRFDDQRSDVIKRKEWDRLDVQFLNQKDGSVIFSMTVANLDEVIDWLFKYKEHATIIEPPELKEKMILYLKKMAENYKV